MNKNFKLKPSPPLTYGVTVTINNRTGVLPQKYKTSSTWETLR